MPERRRFKTDDPVELARTARVFRAARERRYAAMPAPLKRLLAEPVTAKTDRTARFHTLVELCRAAGYDEDTTTATLIPWCEMARKYANRVAAEVARSWPKVDPDRLAGKRDVIAGLIASAPPSGGADA